MSDVRTPALLVIMDGCGLAPAGPENAVSLAKQCQTAVHTAVAGVEKSRIDYQNAQMAVSLAKERLAASAKANEQAQKELSATESVIADAEQTIQEKQAIMKEAEVKSAGLSAGYRKASEALAQAQRELDAANSVLADAEVQVIMAELDS